MKLRLCDLASQFNKTQGEGATVAIVDSGVEASHPAIADQCDSGVVIEERFGKLARKDYDGLDVAGHGTACAGLILKMAPMAKIVSCRILNRSIESTSHALLEALRWVREHEDISVVSMSLGTPNKEFGLEIARHVDALYSKGVPVVVARGYENRPDYPSAFGSPVSVTAEDLEDENQLIYHFGEVVEFGAKGYDLHVPWLGGNWRRVDGSSFAAALVAGRLARWKALSNDLKVWDLKTLLVHQAKDSSS